MDRRISFRVAVLGVFLLALGGTATAHADAQNDTYKDVQKFMAGVAAKYPNAAKLFDLGKGDTGDMIQGLAIGNGPVHNLVVGTHHGNEYGATEVTKAFAEDLAANPIPGQTVYVIPVLNIGGYNARDRYETASDGQSYDPNRDYPGPCGTEGPFKLKDTKLLADFVESHGIVASATLHTFSPAVAYPWGFSTQNTSTAYDDLYIKLGKAATYLSGYTVGNSAEVIYPADGCYEDYVFWKDGVWSLLFELGDTHTPDDTQLKQMIAVNVPGLRKMMETAPTTRAADHAFKGTCDSRLFGLDRHDE